MSAESLSIRVVGDSHVMGYPQLDAQVDLGGGRSTRAVMTTQWLGGGYLAVETVTTDAGGRVVLNPAIAGALQQWPGVGDVPPLDASGRIANHAVLSLGTALYGYDPSTVSGGQFHASQIFPATVDFVLPESPELPVDPACTFLPVAPLREMYQAALTPMKQGLAIMVADYGPRVSVVGAPPPHRDNAKKRQVSARSAGVPLEQIVLPSPVVALKCWRLVTEIVAKLCRSAGCKYIDCSALACDPDGFLKTEFENDGLHGSRGLYHQIALHIISTLASFEASLP